MDHEIIGPAIQQGYSKVCGRRAYYIVGKQLEKRFGKFSSVIEQHLVQLPLFKLEDLSLRLLDARSLDERFNF